MTRAIASGATAFAIRSGGRKDARLAGSIDEGRDTAFTPDRNGLQLVGHDLTQPDNAGLRYRVGRCPSSTH